MDGLVLCSELILFSRIKGKGLPSASEVMDSNFYTSLICSGFVINEVSTEMFVLILWWTWWIISYEIFRPFFPFSYDLIYDLFITNLFVTPNISVAVCKLHPKFASIFI